jgi:GR25 family glycosyltransferase involved in LPS biosynthesis
MQHMIHEFTKHQLIVERFNAVDAKQTYNISKLLPGEYAIILSYAAIIDNAIQHDHEAICIFEDDCVFCDDFNNKFTQIFNQLPKDWHYLNFGPNLMGHQFERTSDQIVKIKSCFATHAVAFRRELFAPIKNSIIKLLYPLDVAIIRDVFPHYNIYGFNPPLIWQLNDYSDIQERHINYDFLKIKA